MCKMHVIVCASIVIFCIISGVKCYKFQATLGHIKPKASQDVQAAATQQLIQRTIPEHASKFLVKVDPQFLAENKETFQVFKDSKGMINIVGTTGVAAATGFHHYLKYFCNAHISWEASQLNLPEELPDVNITIAFNDRFRYYQNVCTTSYSFVWWNWEQWEKHIDWMAMNSFNFVLAFNGQEAIWERVYKNSILLNKTLMNTLLDLHFYHEKILERMRSLGIIPILPAFAGHLPRAITRIYPEVNVTKMDVWNGFNDTYCCPYFLDPTEPLFKVIGKMFIEEQINEFGTDHVYNCDSFNEVDPTTTDLTYLSDVGKSIFGAMTDADSDAIWVMQGWLFVHSFFFWTPSRVKALLTSVPKGKMIILDLQSEEFPQFERLHQYFGQPYIWCMLHDFGGTLGMFGSSSIINENIIKARNQVYSTMIGTGMTPEGINQNYVIYDLMTESAWRNESSDLDEWFKNYTIRRYGKVNQNIIDAWQLLKNSVYDFKGLNRIRGNYAITWTPSLKRDAWTWYDYNDVFKAWKIFVENTDNFKDSPAFLYDLVDLTRQALQIFGDIYYKKFVAAFKSKDYEQFNVESTRFKNIFNDLELILSTNKAFLLGPWIKSARDCAKTTEEADLFEYNAINQITLWGPNGEIINYANKQWSGIAGDYYKPRWDLFITSMNVSLVEKIPFIESIVNEVVFKMAEQPFTFTTNVFPTVPTGNTIEVAQEIYKRWSVLLETNNSNKFEEYGNFVRQQDPLVSFV